MPKPAGYTGYYPGERIPRQPTGRAQPPTYYDLNALANSIEEFEISAAGIPKWTTERFEKALKNSLRVNVFSSPVAAKDLSLYDEEEYEEEVSELSGKAGFSLNINPIDIYKDPKKWLKGVGKDLQKELNPFANPDMNANRKALLWSEITGLTEEGSSSGMLRRARKRQILRRSGQGAFPDVKENPLKLVGVYKAGGKKDVGKSVAQAHVDFQTSARAAIFRDGAFFGDTRKKGIIGETISAGREVFAEHLDEMADPAARGAALSFMARADLLEHMRKVDKAAGGIAETVARLNREVNPKDKKGNPLTLESALQSLQQEIDAAEAHMLLMTKGIDTLTRRQKELLGIIGKDSKLDLTNPYAKMVKKGYTGPLLTAREKRAMHTRMRSFQRINGRVQKIIQGSHTRSGTAILVNRLSRATKNLTGTGTNLGGSIHRKFARALGQEIIKGRGGYHWENLLTSCASADAQQGKKLLRRMRLYIPTQERTRIAYEVDDLTDALYSGNVWNIYLWMRQVNPRLKALTPDYYLTKFLERMHYFGLKVNEDFIFNPDGSELKPKFFLYRLANKAIKNFALFSNKFAIDIEGIGKRTVVGGQHFSAIAKLSEFIADKKLDRLKLAKLMTGNADEVKEILEKLFDSEEELKAFTEEFMRFRKWIEKNAKKLGIDIKNGEHILRLTKALKKYDNNTIKNIGIGITKAYRGKLQHFVQKLSVIRNIIFKSFVGKAVNLYLNWKAIVSAIIAEALFDIIAGVTGGMGILVKPLQWVMQSITRVLVDTGEALLKAVFKADLGELEKFIDKSLTNILKFFAFTMSGVLMMAIIPVFIFSAMLSTISPENNAKEGGGSVGNFGGSGHAPELPMIAPGGCPIPGGVIWGHNYSYGYDPQTGRYLSNGTGHAQWGHGTDAYWGDGACSYPLPGGFVSVERPYKHSENAGRCSYHNNGSPYYGMAADFTEPVRNNEAIYAPALGEEVDGKIEWNVLGITNGTQGQGVYLYREDGTHIYKMWMLHMTNLTTAAAAGNTIEAGRHLGYFWGGYGDSWKHVHIEISVDGTPIRPEQVLCL